jgi:hypothetical protein
VEMSHQDRVYNHMSLFSKNWDKAFHVRRERRKKEESWVRFRRSIHSVGEPWDILWRNHECGGESVHFTKMLRKFCQGLSVNVLENPQSHCHPAMHRMSVRLDDREISHHTEPPYPITLSRTEELTACGLYQRLKLPVREKSQLSSSGASS